MMSFIHNGSEITSWIGHSFKTITKSTTSTSRATFLPWHFLRWYFFEFQAADHQISTSTLEL